MRGYFDPVVKAHQYAQYVDGSGITANTDTDFTRKIRAFFESIRKAGLKVRVEMSLSGVRQIEILDRNISTGRISAQAREIQVVLNKFRIPKSKKHYSPTWFQQLLQKLNSWDGWEIQRIL